jgi:hypothetical protein
MINQVDLRIPDFQTNRDNSEYIHWLNMIVPDMIPGLMNAGYHDGDMGIFSSTIFFWICLPTTNRKTMGRNGVFSWENADQFHWILQTIFGETNIIAQGALHHEKPHLVHVVGVLFN